MTSEQHRGGEEVDLGALFASLWAQKLLIVCVTVAFLLMAALYAFTRQPVYQADLVIVAPSHNDISSLNYGRGEASGLPLLSVADVYSIYTRYLQSESAPGVCLMSTIFLRCPPSERCCRRMMCTELFRVLS